MSLKEGEDPVIWSEVPGIGSVFTWTDPHAQSWSGMESYQLAALGQQGSGWVASQAGLQEPLHPKKPFPQGSHEQQGHPQPGDRHLLWTRARAGATPPMNRPSEPPLPQHNRNERCRDEGCIHFKQGNFHLKCCLESNPPQQHFVPLTRVYQFLLTTVSWLRDKKAQFHWYYILYLQTDYGD